MLRRITSACGPGKFGLIAKKPLRGVPHMVFRKIELIAGMYVVKTGENTGRAIDPALERPTARPVGSLTGRRLIQQSENRVFAFEIGLFGLRSKPGKVGPHFAFLKVSQGFVRRSVVGPLGGHAVNHLSF